MGSLNGREGRNGMRLPTNVTNGPNESTAQRLQGGVIGRVRPEWPLIKAQAFLGEALAPRGSREIVEGMFCAQLLQLHQYVPDLSLVADGLLEPTKLLGTQGDSNGFWTNSPRPLIAGAALAGFVSLDQAAQGNPADA